PLKHALQLRAGDLPFECGRGDLTEATLARARLRLALLRGCERRLDGRVLEQFGHRCRRCVATRLRSQRANRANHAQSDDARCSSHGTLLGPAQSRILTHTLGPAIIQNLGSTLASTPPRGN